MMGYGTEEQTNLLGSPAQSAPLYQQGAAPAYQQGSYPTAPYQLPQAPVIQPYQLPQAPVVPQQPGPFLHAYVMGAAPPSGPVCVYDVNHIRYEPHAGVGTPASHFELLTISTSSSSTRLMIVINYLLGLLFIPHLLSVIGSLHAYQTGQIVANRTAVLTLSFLEIAAWFLVACASWSFVEYPVDSARSGYSETYEFYFGWVYIILWFVVYLVCGIPRVIYSTKSNPYVPVQSQQQEMSLAEADKCRRIALGLYIAGIFVSPLEIVSLGYSLYLLDKGQVVTNKAGLLACSVLELCGWIMGAALSWAYSPRCHSSYYSCGVTYWGWAFLIVWFSFAIACGIPRVVITYRGKKPAFDQNQQSYAKL